MELATDCLFKQLRPKARKVCIVEIGHDAQPFVQLGVKLATEVFTAYRHGGSLFYAAVREGSKSRYLRTMAGSALTLPPLSFWKKSCRSSGTPVVFHPDTDAEVMPAMRATSVCVP